MDKTSILSTYQKKINDTVLKNISALKSKYTKKNIKINSPTFLQLLKEINTIIVLYYIKINAQFVKLILVIEAKKKQTNYEDYARIIRTIVSNIYYKLETDASKNTYQYIINQFQKKLKKIKLVNKCNSDIYPVDPISFGSGAFGSLHQLKNDPTKAVKILDLSYLKNEPEINIHIQEIINEISIMNILNKTDISPKIYDYWLCIEPENNQLYLYLLVQKLDSDLSTWLKTNTITKSQQKQINQKIKAFHKLGFIHNDLHLGNILVKTTANKTNFYLNDFGLSLTHDQLVEKKQTNEINIINALTKSKNIYAIAIITSILIIIDINIII